MDEQIEKLIALAGNNHRYQYFTLVVIVFLWINCNFLAIIIPFIEREPLINYVDKQGEYHENVTLTNEICELYDNKIQNIDIVERFKYSWVSEYDIECDKFYIGLMGSFVFVGNTGGAVVFSIINKLMTHKTILIISSFGFCIAIFLNTLVTSFSYFYCSLICLIFIGTFGNCLCYSSLVLAEEIVASNKRSLFSSIINIGYSLSGIIYSLLFWWTQDWRIIYYICIGASLLALALIWAFIYDSPRVFINKKDFKNSMRILEGIASFNGRLQEFREGLQQPEFQDILSDIKGENDEKEKSQSHQEGEEEKEENKENIEMKNSEDKGENEENIIERETNKEIYRKTENNINRVTDRESNELNIISNKESVANPDKDKKDASEPLLNSSSTI